MGHVRQEMKFVMLTVMRAFQYFYPWTYQTRSDGIPDFYLLPNFGELEFDFAGSPAGSPAGIQPAVKVRVLDGRSGAVAFEKTYALKDLDSAPERAAGAPQCRPHRGEPSAVRRAGGWVCTACVALLLLATKPLVAALLVWGLLRGLRRRRRQKAARETSVETAQVKLKNA
jgi:hypothetical protein